MYKYILITITTKSIKNIIKKCKFSKKYTSTTFIVIFYPIKIVSVEFNSGLNCSIL